MKSFTSNKLHLLAKASQFSSVARRAYGTGSRGYSMISPDLEEEFRKKFDPISEEFANHRALEHPLFDFLEEQSKTGFTTTQYAIYRDNFFRRTELTIPSVARFIEKAAMNGDHQAVVDTIRNLNDEGGYGDIKKMHSNLLAESHNLHGMRVFNLNPAQILNIIESPNLVPAVEEYRRSKQLSFDRPYPYIAGNTWAHELAADNMLDNFRKALFAPYQGYYTPEEYTKLTEFFTAHKDDSIDGGDIEAQHERMARGAAERACRDGLQNVDEVREGGLEFLNVQEKLWDGLLIGIEKAESIGSIIQIKPIDVGIPAPSISASSAESKSVKTPGMGL